MKLTEPPAPQLNQEFAEPRPDLRAGGQGFDLDIGHIRTRSVSVPLLL